MSFQFSRKKLLLFVGLFSAASALALVGCMPVPPLSEMGSVSPTSLQAAPSETPLLVTQTLYPTPRMPLTVPTRTATATQPPETAVHSTPTPIQVLDRPISLSQLEGSDQPLTSFAFSPDAKLLAAGAESGYVWVWDVEQRTLRYELNLDSNVFSLAFSPDGNRFGIGQYNGLTTVWEAFAGARLQRLESEFSRVYGVAFSPDGQLLATARQDGDVYLWDLESGEMVAILEGQDEFQLRNVVFSRDGAMLAAVSITPGVWLWDVDERLPVGNLDAESLISTAAFSSDGKILAVGRAISYEILLWSVPDRTLVHTLEPALHVLAMAFLNNDEMLVTFGLDNQVRYWNTGAGSLLQAYQLDKVPISGAALTNGGSLLAVGEVGGDITLWALP